MYASLAFKMTVFLGFLTWLLSSCNEVELTPVAVTATPTAPEPTVTNTPFVPTPTPIPLAAVVNGDPITLDEFNAELSRFNAAQVGDGEVSEFEADAIVLNDLIDQVLLAQAAWEAGFEMDDVTFRSRLKQLEEDAGGEAALASWLVENHYTLESFERALAHSIAAAWMRDQIIAAVPKEVEQVRARQILVRNQAQADQILRRLNAGEDFAALAIEFDPIRSGDLGWFPRGFLFEPLVEEAAFNLEPEEYSEVIETRLGFHIIQVIERDTDRPLDPNARLILQLQAIEEWLENRRQESVIEMLVTLSQD